MPRLAAPGTASSNCPPECLPNLHHSRRTISIALDRPRSHPLHATPDADAASTALTALLDSHVHYRGTVCRTGGLRCGTAASELRKEDPMMSNGVMREMSSCCQSCQCCECR